EDDSDIDLIVVVRELDDRHALTMQARRALRPLGLPFDVLVFSQAELEEWGEVVGHVLNTALTEGRVAYAA
ncbi:MAG: nucleotidyltransferase domain-containing protein, partial [Actinomycetota bacterium]